MMTGEKKCPHCGRDPDGCSVWSDADMGWVCEATGEVIPDGDPDVAIYADPVTASGRVELLPFLREQSVSITNHRYGLVDHGLDPVLPRK